MLSFSVRLMLCAHRLLYLKFPMYHLYVHDSSSSCSCSLVSAKNGEVGLLQCFELFAKRTKHSGLFLSNRHQTAAWCTVSSPYSYSYFTIIYNHESRSVSMLNDILSLSANCLVLQNSSVIGTYLRPLLVRLKI